MRLDEAQVAESFGWLAKLGTNIGLGHGVLDFAGSSVVHAVGGLVGLAGILVIIAIYFFLRRTRAPTAPRIKLMIQAICEGVLSFSFIFISPPERYV